MVYSQQLLHDQVTSQEEEFKYSLRKLLHDRNFGICNLIHVWVEIGVLGDDKKVTHTQLLPKEECLLLKPR